MSGPRFTAASLCDIVVYISLVVAFLVSRNSYSFSIQLAYEFFPVVDISSLKLGNCADQKCFRVNRASHAPDKALLNSK